MTTTLTQPSPPLPSLSEETTSGRWSRILRLLRPFFGLILVFLIFGALKPETFLTTTNLRIMVAQSAVVGVAALGMTMIIISGGIDLSVASNIALCSVVVPRLMNLGLPPSLGALGGLLAGAACGLLIGTLITTLRLTPFVVTLGMWGALRGLATGLADRGTVRAASSWLNDALSALGSQRWLSLPWGVWLMFLLAIIIAVILRYTRFGRHVFAIGSNEQTARLCGVRVARTKILVYTLSGALAGIAGVMQFGYVTVGDATTATGMELDIIAAVIIGGASLAGGEGTILGTLIGAFIMTAVANGCTKMGLDNWVQQIVTGGIIILAVAVDRWRTRTPA